MSHGETGKKHTKAVNENNEAFFRTVILYKVNNNMYTLSTVCIHIDSEAQGVYYAAGN